MGVPNKTVYLCIFVSSEKTELQQGNFAVVTFDKKTKQKKSNVFMSDWQP